MPKNFFSVLIVPVRIPTKPGRPIGRTSLYRGLISEVNYFLVAVDTRHVHLWGDTKNKNNNRDQHTAIG